MDDIVKRLRRMADPNNRIEDLRDLDRAADEIERLRALLRHADDMVIWEHTPARAGFQEEIEEALGIGTHEQK